MIELKIHRMHNFFLALAEGSEPHAIKVFRKRPRVILRDNDDNVDIMSSYSKRGLYVRLIIEMVLNAKSNGWGNFGKLCDCGARDCRDDWVEGVN